MTIYRHFYLKSNALTRPDVNLRDLPSAGRIDIVARCVNSAFWLSNDIRRNVFFHTILHGPPNPPVYIRFEGGKLRKVSPDERSIAIFTIKAIEKASDEEKESTPGIFVSRKDFKKFVDENRDKEYYLMDEKGEDIDKINFGEEPLFFLGDNKGLNDEEKEILHRYGAIDVSIGKKSYLSSHCINVINWFLDKIEER
ncbi:MAG: tRNA (pseudouridine(54)-N(1))-methyltransferase TrmY [Thermoplasmatales archaeon]|nr:tRNA (pseudouridine(54)-N(1))-methyltransferase TrmY [Thermoplasmatales archaeon]